MKYILDSIKSEFISTWSSFVDWWASPSLDSVRGFLGSKPLPFGLLTGCFIGLFVVSLFNPLAAVFLLPQLVVLVVYVWGFEFLDWWLGSVWKRGVNWFGVIMLLQLSVFMVQGLLVLSDLKNTDSLYNNLVYKDVEFRSRSCLEAGAAPVLSVGCMPKIPETTNIFSSGVSNRTYYVVGG